MFSPENIFLVKELLIEEARKSPTILGAKIGDLVKKHLPTENVRTTYGSVKNFVEKNFSEIMKMSGRQGIDNVYTFNSEFCSNGEMSSELQKEKKLIPESKLIGKEKQSISAHDSDAMLRAAIKESIELMTSEQIRQLAVPAGILIDAFIKTTRR